MELADWVLLAAPMVLGAIGLWSWAVEGAKERTWMDWCPPDCRPPENQEEPCKGCPNWEEQR